MSDRITRTDCEGLLRRLTAQTELEMSPSVWPIPEGALFIQDESGVKRVVTGSGRGVADNGWPGFSTYRELWGFLRGMVALAEMQRGTDAWDIARARGYREGVRAEQAKRAEAVAATIAAMQGDE